MATNYDRTVFVNGAEPAINAENLNKITAFCDAIASGGAGSVVSADLALNSNNLSGKGLDAATSTTPDKIPLRDANGIVRNPAVNPNNGLVFAASPTLPEYPDNAAGTTYLRNNNFTASDINIPGPTTTKYGWANITPWDGTGLAVNNGIMQFEKTVSTGGILRISIAPQNKTYRIKVYPAANATLAINADGISSNRSVIANIWNLVDVSFDGTGLGFVDIENFPVGIHYISGAYIGDGTYSSRLLDASGNGNHGTVFGATPTADGGLSFDGVNDYVELGNAFNFERTQPFSMFFSFKTGSLPSDTTTRYYAGNLQAAAGSKGWRVAQFQSSMDIRLACNHVNANGDITISRGVAPNTEYNYIITYDGLSNSNSLKLYDATGLIATSTGGPLTTSTVSPFTTRIGRTTGVTYNHNQFTLNKFRVYQKVLTAAEIEALATNPDAYNLDRVVRSITPVPGSVMTRNTVGGSELANLKLTGVASADPNTLDFYEEGTFTPNFLIDGSGTGITYVEGRRNGQYTRIGNRVFISIDIWVNTHPGGTGAITVSGLPFAATTIGDRRNPFVVRYSGISQGAQLTVHLNNGSAVSGLNKISTSGTETQVIGTDLTTQTPFISIAGQYEI